jgi:hypothetical protein
MGTTTHGSGGTKEILYDMAPIARDVAMAEAEARGFIFDKVVTHLGGLSRNAVKVMYDNENGWTVGAQSDYRRPLNANAPRAARSTFEDLDINLDGIGQVVPVDEKDEFAQPDEMARQTYGSRRSAGKLAMSKERMLGDLIASATDPWTVTQLTAPALWSVATTDILAQYVTQMQAYEALHDSAVRPNAHAISRKAADYVAMNTKLVEQFGGNTGVGRLNMEQVGTAFASIGLDTTLIGPTSIYGSYANMFHRPPGEAPDARMSPAGIIYAHHGDAGDEVIVEEMHPDFSIWEYYAYVWGGLGVVPEHGARIKTIYS